MERSAHGVQLSRSAHAHFSSLLNFETPKSQENNRTITIYVKSIDLSFFPFWESSGLEMAGWLAGLGAASSSQPACQPSQPGQLPG